MTISNIPFPKHIFRTSHKSCNNWAQAPREEAPHLRIWLIYASYLWPQQETSSAYTAESAPSIDSAPSSYWQFQTSRWLQGPIIQRLEVHFQPINPCLLELLTRRLQHSNRANYTPGKPRWRPRLVGYQAETPIWFEGAHSCYLSTFKDTPSFAAMTSHPHPESWWH